MYTRRHSTSSARLSTRPQVHPSALSLQCTPRHLASSACLYTQPRVHVLTLGLKCTLRHSVSSAPFDTQSRVHPSALNLNCTLRHLASSARLDTQPQVYKTRFPSRPTSPDVWYARKAKINRAKRENIGKTQIIFSEARNNDISFFVFFLLCFGDTFFIANITT
ncbi:hypothetical protein VNO78_06384 [Psophocarpus tetragonolobus]|uniref:Uncharacterized protein n=1 Tax=Psophocarpus tetragonolobus TaxID=3891 RepID=A0AAN9SV29_PSOTE